VAPGKSCNRLLHEVLAGPGGGHGPHVLQVATGEAALLGEGGAQVGGEAVDDLGTPARVLLAVRMSRPMDQYRRSSSVLAARAVRTWAVRTRCFSASSSST
jgi:hypothetical protein